MQSPTRPSQPSCSVSPWPPVSFPRGAPSASSPLQYFATSNKSQGSRLSAGALLQRRSGRSTEQRCADREREMMTLGAAGGPRRDDRREPAGPERQTERIAANHVVEAEALLLERHLTLFGGQPDADRCLEDRMLEALLQHEQMRAAEAVVLVAGQDAVAVDVGTADRLLKVERDHIPGRDAGSRREKAESDTPRVVAGSRRRNHRRAFEVAGAYTALVRAVGISRQRRRHGVVQREFVRQIQRPPPERECRV